MAQEDFGVSRNGELRDSLHQRLEHGPIMDCAMLMENFGGPVLPQRILRALDHLTGLRALNYECQAAGLRPGMPSETVAAGLLRQLNIALEISRQKEAAPELRSGPLVVVANHPFGFADAFALTSLIGTLRDDWLALCNTFLAAARIDAKRLLFVDLFGKARAALNRVSLRTALRHLAEGGCLVVFPGTFCAQFNLRKRMIVDRQWSDHIRQLVARSHASVLPVYFEGNNSPLFALAGFVPSARTVLHGRELLRRRNSSIKIHIGAPLPWSVLRHVSSAAMTEYLRANVYALKFASSKAATANDRSSHHFFRSTTYNGELAAEFERLRETKRVAGTANLNVLLLRSDDSPAFISAVFGVHARAGFSRDRYDEQNHHLIGWDTANSRIFGTYRLKMPAESEPLLSDYASAQSFRFSAAALPLLTEGIELGRACIVPEYQKEYAALLALWFGLIAVWHDNPRYRFLFGPAWIQNSYHPKSVALITRYIAAKHRETQFWTHVTPKQALRRERFAEFDVDRIVAGANDFRTIDHLVRAIEGGWRGAPILFKRYLEVGARFAGFARWRELGDVTVGLAVLDKANASSVCQSLTARFRRGTRAVEDAVLPR